MNTYPVVRGVRLPRPIRRTQYQLNAYIENAAMTSETCYKSAIELVKLWIGEKTSEMPEVRDALNKSLGDINISYNGIAVRTVHLLEEEKNTWALSFIHPDDVVATRLWETQVVICLQNNKVKLFTENSFSVSVTAEDPTPTVPGFVRAIVEQIGLVETCPLSLTPWTIEDEDDVEKLYEVITNHDRQLPVIVLSSPDYHKWPITGYAPEYMISGAEVARKCFGRCIVVQLPYRMGFKWSELVGRTWAVFDGGVRIYQPGLDFDNDDIYIHTLYSKTKILGWKRNSDEVPSYQCFEQYLISEIKRKPTLLSSGSERIAFTAIMQKKLERQREENITNEEAMKSSYEEQISILREEKEFHKELAEEAYQKYTQYEKDNEVLKEKNYDLECLVEQLKEALKFSGKTLEDIIPIPDNYDEMGDWCRKYLDNKLEFTNRARRAVGKDVETLYSDVALVYKCLLFLATEYRDGKLGKINHDEIEDKLKSLQVENRPSVTQSQAGRYEEEYYYTDAKGKHLVDMHLVRGTSRDTKQSLRIYYYWDDEDKKVVVVSLTRHLTTDAT
ncbi:hypothetical protein [uncultured Oscillibacter sp.]|uniref:hypothetical protein n=1 Tax=uncultured Oscillibacter sp. TaxID=876091 RepID=UPI0025DB0E8F|nr:hypothetical protein [uncultured Oscillibacter sp.]